MSQLNEEIISANNEVIDAVTRDNSTISEVSSETQEYSDIEKQAMEMGWDPNHKGRTFVSAAEYVNRRPLFERLEKQNIEIRELKELQRQSFLQLAAIRKEGYDAAINELQMRRNNAEQDNDFKTYKELETRQHELKKQMDSDPTLRVPAASEDPAVTAFKTRNASWYNNNTTENAEMAAFAFAAQTFLLQQANIKGQPYASNQQLFSDIEKAVKERYPNRFSNVRREEPMAVAKSTVSNANTKNLVQRLTPEQVAVAKVFHEKEGNKRTFDEYLKRYAELVFSKKK